MKFPGAKLKNWFFGIYVGKVVAKLYNINRLYLKHSFDLLLLSIVCINNLLKYNPACDLLMV